MEKPLGQESRGTWTAAVYTAEQQARLGVDKAGAKAAETNAGAGAHPQHPRCGTTPPPRRPGFPSHWGAPPRRQTRDLVEFPGGYGRGSGTVRRWIKDKMAADAADAANTTTTTTTPPCRIVCGKASTAVCTDAGTADAATDTDAQPVHQAHRIMCGGRGSVGPAWARGEVEKPRGQESRGTWTAAVYTAEQQARLGVDKAGTLL